MHDAVRDLGALVDALSAEFIVREARTPFEALERLSGAPLACVVCVVGGAIRAEDFFQLVAHAAPDQVRRLLFVASPFPDDAERAFFESAGAHWLAAAHAPAEALAVVRAVSMTRP